jgi:hypothetical protein
MKFTSAAILAALFLFFSFPAFGSRLHRTARVHYHGSHRAYSHGGHSRGGGRLHYKRNHHRI